MKVPLTTIMSIADNISLIVMQSKVDFAFVFTRIAGIGILNRIFFQEVGGLLEMNLKRVGEGKKEEKCE